MTTKKKCATPSILALQNYGLIIGDEIEKKGVAPVRLIAAMAHNIAAMIISSAPSDTWHDHAARVQEDLGHRMGVLKNSRSEVIASVLKTEEKSRLTSNLASRLAGVTPSFFTCSDVLSGLINSECALIRASVPGTEVADVAAEVSRVIVSTLEREKLISGN